MPAGRPTDYRPEMCGEVIELLKEGASIEEIGLELDVGYTTVYLWMDKHPEFMKAVKKGREFSKGWWMKEGRISMRDKDFNSTLWYMNMKNRHGWADKQEIAATVTEETQRQVRQKQKDLCK
jgi:hypothetical protein